MSDNLGAAALSWILSLTSAIMLWQMGNKNKWGPRIGIANQVLWIIYVGLTKQWGLLPGVFLFLITHIRNLIKWERK